MNIVYQTVTKEWTQIPKICNTNNHKLNEHKHLSGATEEISSDEYRHQLSLTNKNVWNQYFPDPQETIKIHLSYSYCKILEQASVVGYLKRGRPSNIEELEEIENYIRTFLPDTSTKPWFVRVNEASPKDGLYDAGPLLSAKDIVTSLSTSLRIHKAFNSLKPACGDILYLVPWRRDWNEELEFRVFVHEGRVTCFSQYVWHRDVGWGGNSNSIQIVSAKILEFCNNKVIPIFPLTSYVVDVIIILETDVKIREINEDTKLIVEVIEFNSFGVELASGSALFHWINDFDILYGKYDSVVVKYVSEEIKN
jgi:hypothetical protein